MKQIGHYLGSIDWLEILPLLGMFIFIAFFIAIVIHTMKMNKKDIKEFSNMPIEDKDDAGTNY